MVALLVVLAAAVYGQTVNFGFITLDDPIYVSRNENVAQGLTLAGVRWALTAVHASMWQPLTWLSHMLDISVYGLAAGGHHLTNVVLHALNAALWYAAFLGMTGARWRAAALAALFLVHPLRAEPVAWVSERRELLATFLALLALLAYVRAVRRGRVLRSAAIPVLFTLALAAKPMPVTLPFLLLLLDWWPLGRWSPAGATPHRPLPTPAALLPPLRLWIEKLPLFLLAAASAILTLRFTGAGGVIVSLEALPLGRRVAAAVLSSAGYLGKMLWPADLAVFYPHLPSFPPLGVIAPPVGLLAALSLLAAWQARQRPWLAVGWLWYLIALVPVIGLVQAGSHAMADRYTYLPGIGVVLALVWTGAELARSRPAARFPVAVAAAAATACLAIVGWHQTRLWSDEVLLFRHATRVVADNAAALSHLGSVLVRRGDLAGAEEQFLLSLEADPGFSGSHANYAFLLHRQGRFAEAREHAERAMAISPGPGRRFKLPELLAAIDRDESAAGRHANELRFREGVRLAGEGRDAEAVAAFEDVLAADPDHAAALNNLGALYAQRGELERALPRLLRAVEVRPEYAEARYNLGNALAAAGRLQEAEAAFQEALRLKPDAAHVAANLGVVQERRGLAAAAAESYRHALRIEPGNSIADAGLTRLRETRREP